MEIVGQIDIVAPSSHRIHPAPNRFRKFVRLEAVDERAEPALAAFQEGPRKGKGRRDRDVPLSPALLEELRGYWRWMKPKTFLFPGLVDGWRADVPITDKMVWFACQSAARAAGIEKHISPHTLRNASAYCTTFQSCSF